MKKYNYYEMYNDRKIEGLTLSNLDLRCYGQLLSLFIRGNRCSFLTSQFLIKMKSFSYKKIIEHNRCRIFRLNVRQLHQILKLI